MVSSSKSAPDLASELRTGRRSVAPAASSSIVSTEFATSMVHSMAPTASASIEPGKAAQRPMAGSQAGLRSSRIWGCAFRTGRGR